VPEGAFILPVRVRSYEVDRRGQLAAGTVVRYLEAIATEHSAALGFDFRWYERQGAAWVVRDMHLRLGVPPGIGDELLVATWVSDYRRVQAQREYAVWCAGSARPVARASARWAYVDRVRGQPQRLFDAFTTSFPLLGSRFAAPALPPPPAEATPELRRHELALTAREFEMDSQGHINNCVYLDWLLEGLGSGASHGLGREGEVWRPRDLQIEYIRPVQAGDTLTVATTMAAQARRELWAWQEIVRAEDGAMCVRARSRYLTS
jgi:acyl-CoA thioester hydrolase